MAIKRRFGALKNIIDGQAKRARVLARIDDLPSSPAIAVEIDRLVSDPNSTVSEIESRILQDQALVAKLLRLVNSSFYGLPRPVTSVARAIPLAGMKTIRNLVFAVTTSPILEKNLPVYGYAGQGLWTHSLVTAIASQVICTELKVKGVSPEEVFVAGLLHDVGKLILGEFVMVEDDALVSGSEGCRDRERELTGFDHAELGADIAAKWNMSEMLSALIAHHHEPENAGDFIDMALLVALADSVAKMLGIGLDQERCIPSQISPAVSKRFNLDAGFFDAISPPILEKFEMQKELFQS